MLQYPSWMAWMARDRDAAGLRDWDVRGPDAWGLAWMAWDRAAADCCGGLGARDADTRVHPLIPYRLGSPCQDPWQRV